MTYARWTASRGVEWCLRALATPKPRSLKRTHSYRIASMKTLRFLLINRAARLARFSGRQVLRFSSNPATETLYDRVTDHLAA
jgi:hypothetical protein